MKIKNIPILLSLVLLTISFICPPIQASEWRFPVGISFVSGFSAVKDYYVANLAAEGYYVESIDSLPAGIACHPFYQLDNGFGIGGGVGPIMLIVGDASLFLLPINFDVSYYFFPERKLSLYCRAGGRYNIASGDYVEGSKPGLLGALGLEFFKKKRINFRFELAYDSSAIELEHLSYREIETVMPSEFMVSFFAIF